MCAARQADIGIEACRKRSKVGIVLGSSSKIESIRDIRNGVLGLIAGVETLYAQVGHVEHRGYAMRATSV
jgi:hypothetical protein